MRDRSLRNDTFNGKQGKRKPYRIHLEIRRLHGNVSCVDKLHRASRPHWTCRFVDHLKLRETPFSVDRLQKEFLLSKNLAFLPRSFRNICRRIFRVKSDFQCYRLGDRKCCMWCWPYNRLHLLYAV